MDLKALLDLNKSKAKRSQPVRNPVRIAIEDRPLSLSESSSIPDANSLAKIYSDEQLMEATSSKILTATPSPPHDIKISPETQHKPNTNQTQSEHKPNTKYTQELNTNQTQTKHIKIIKTPNQTQTQHKVHTKLNTRKTQSTHKLDTNSTQTAHISTLIGVQRLILFFIFEECKKARSHITEPLSVTHIASSLEIAPGSIKTSISRLCEKEFLIVNSFKNGRGGWSTYEIPKNIYNELLQMETQHKLHTNSTQSTHKLDTKPNTEPNTKASSSSSLNINTTTTVSDEWSFDVTPYNRFGFGNAQLKQLAPLAVISASDVEQSLIEFNFDFENHSLPLIRGSKVGFLMGLFRKGVTYTSEAYLNDQEATISEMARRSKEKRERLLNEKFEAWEASLEDSERKIIESQLPPHLIVLYRSHGILNSEIRTWLFNYYISSQK